MANKEATARIKINKLLAAVNKNKGLRRKGVPWLPRWRG
jgi:hypothetical protein